MESAYIDGFVCVGMLYRTHARNGACEIARNRNGRCDKYAHGNVYVLPRALRVSSVERGVKGVEIPVGMAGHVDIDGRAVFDL